MRLRTFRRTAVLCIAFACLAPAVVTHAYADSVQPAKAPADAAAKSAVIDEILDLSGIKRALESIPGQIEDEMDNPEGEYSKLPEEQREQLRVVMLEAFEPERLIVAMKQTLADNYRQPVYEAVRARLNSAQGRRLTELEAQLTVADIEQRLQEYAAALDATPAPPKRRKLISELDKAALTSETILDLSVASFGAVALASREDQVPLDEKALRKVLEGIRAKLRPAIAGHASLMLLYVHRDVSDRELQGFVRFYQDQNMKVMSGIVRKGFGRAMNEGFRDMLKKARNIRGDTVRT
jgi:CHASE3 domain sensor protein